MNLDRIFWRIGALALYRCKAVNKHHIHSPFVFNLLCDVIKNPGMPGDCARIDDLSTALKASMAPVSVDDFGAGRTLSGQKSKLTIGQIAKSSSSGKTKGHLLARLSERFRPLVMIELGTNLGLGSLYLTSPVHTTRLYTLEGSAELANYARQHFRRFHREGIEVIMGNFDLTLLELLKRLPVLDLVFLDGNHTHEATLRYALLMQPHLAAESLMVVDDIRWSPGMWAAWNDLRISKQFSISLDFGTFGLLFCRKGIPKQHFILRR